MVGFVGYFEFSHFKIKKELKTLLKKGVPHNDLVKFQFTKAEISELIWIKKSEFSLNESLYDVVWKKNIGNGKVEFECISDKKESILFTKLNQTISFNLINDSSSSNIPVWFKLLQTPFSPLTCTINIEPSIIEFEAKKEPSIYLDHYSSILIPIDTPPPNALFS